MNYLIAIGISVFISAIISYFWVKGIDHMQKNYPDYKGDDLFGENEEKDRK